MFELPFKLPARTQSLTVEYNGSVDRHKYGPPSPTVDPVPDLRTQLSLPLVDTASLSVLACFHDDNSCLYSLRKPSCSREASMGPPTCVGPSGTSHILTTRPCLFWIEIHIFPEGRVTILCTYNFGHAMDCHSPCTAKTPVKIRF